MKFFKKRYLAICALFLALFSITKWEDTPVLAASANISFTTNDTEVEAGTEFTVILEISADTTIGDFEGYLTYDANLVEYTYGPSCITGGDGYLKIADVDASPSSKLRSYVMTFTALKYGRCSFEMSGIPVVYKYEDGSTMSVLSEPFGLQIMAQKDASSNADLDILRVSPGTLVPSFASEITEYEVTVGEDTQRLIVSAVPQDRKSSVTVLGNENLEIGENSVTVTITAENGTVKVYQILVTRKQESTTPEVTPEITQEPEPEEKKTLFVEKEDDTFLCGNYRYKLVDSKGLSIPDGYTADYLLIDGESIPVYISSENEEYCLLALENEAGEKALYRFDRTEYTIQRYSPEVITVTDTSQQARKIEELLAKTSEYEKNKNIMSIIAGGLGAVILLLGILCIRFYIRSKGYDDDLD